MDFQIRQLQPEELEKILELQASSLRTLSSSYNSKQIESLVRSQASARLAKDEIGILAEYKHEIIGFASVLINQSRIAGVYVHPNFMRQGIGTRLLASIETIAVKHGQKVIYVTSSLPAVNFYQARGYQFINKSGFYSENTSWIPCVNLQKRLISNSETPSWHVSVISLISSFSNFFNYHQ